MHNEDLYDFYEPDNSDISVQNWSGPETDPVHRSAGAIF